MKDWWAICPCWWIFNYGRKDTDPIPWPKPEPQGEWFFGVNIVKISSTLTSMNSVSKFFLSINKGEWLRWRVISWETRSPSAWKIPYWHEREWDKDSRKPGVSLDTGVVGIGAWRPCQLSVYDSCPSKLQVTPLHTWILLRSTSWEGAELETRLLCRGSNPSLAETGQTYYCRVMPQDSNMPVELSMTLSAQFHKWPGKGNTFKSLLHHLLAHFLEQVTSMSQASVFFFFFCKMGIEIATAGEGQWWRYNGKDAGKTLSTMSSTQWVSKKRWACKEE